MADPLPKVTGDGVRRLIAHLNQEDAPHVNPTIKAKIDALTHDLDETANILDSGGTASWVQVALRFKELTPLLAQALNVNAGTETGKCEYQGGCIQTTRTQCDILGGQFTPGAICSASASGQ